MPDYAYEALDRSGKQIRGTIEAANEELILDKLRDMGFYALRIEPRRVRHGAGGTRVDIGALPVLRWWFHRVKSRDVMSFTRELATLIDAGLPIMRSLAILREQTESVIFRERIGAIGRDVESGSSLSEAMGRHPGIFDKLYINMVRAGEIGGVLEAVLNKIAEFQEKREALKSKVKSAMAYPVVVMLLAGIIVGFILWKIIPKFQDIFGQLGGELPLPTLILIKASHVLVNFAWIPVVAAILLVVGLRQVKKYSQSRYYRDWLILRLPVFGDLFRKIAITRFAGTLSTLINAGVPILQALEIVRDSSGNEVVARAVARVYQNVKDGETIHEPLAECDVFPPLVVHMVAVGEETGSIDLMLNKVAEAYERHVDDTVNALTSIMEPLMIVFLGGTVGMIVIALYMPLFNLGGLIKP